MEVLERILSVVRGEEPDKVPVVLLCYGLVLKSIYGVKEIEYYQNVKLQLDSKIEFIKMFPEILNMQMGTYPEYGEFVGPIPTAFGGKLGWHEDDPPYVAEPPIKTPEDVDRLAAQGVPDPRIVGVTQEILRRLDYFIEHFPKDLREKYGYIDGNLYPGLCVEGAALSMGYDKFLIWLRLHPDVIHKWLRLATDFYLKYCDALEEKVGKCKFLFIPDHMASMVSKKQFEEFILPYLNKVFNRYKGAIRIWHNEGYVGYMLDAVDKIDAEVWHLGPKENLIEVKEKTHFVMCGNLHPPHVVKSTPQQIEEECRDLILKAAPGGRFFLSTGGGMAPGTTAWQIRAFIRAADKYGVYPIRRVEK